MRFARPLVIAVLAITSCCLCYSADVPATYTAQCASCHGADGRGKANSNSKFKIPDLRAKEVQDLNDTDLYESIARGTKHKEYPHAFLYRGLKDKDVRELVTYIRTLARPAK